MIFLDVIRSRFLVLLNGTGENEIQNCPPPPLLCNSRDGNPPPGPAGPGPRPISDIPPPAAQPDTIVIIFPKISFLRNSSTFKKLFRENTERILN